MNLLILAFIPVFLAATATSALHALDQTKNRSSSPPKTENVPYDKAWVMSSRWTGYMGVAIALKGDKYFYWFYSDVGGGTKIKYPITGSYKISGEYLILANKVQKAGQGELLYANQWKFVKRSGKICLSAENDLEDYGRSLVPDSNFSFTSPFENQPNLFVDANPRPPKPIPTAPAVPSGK